MTLYDRIKSGEFNNTYPYPNATYLKANGWDDRLKEEKMEYARQERLKLDAFEAAALADVGLDTHPNREAIYNHAWSQGHASGLWEVYQCLSDIADLFFINGKMLNAYQNDKGEFHAFN